MPSSHATRSSGPKPRNYRGWLEGCGMDGYEHSQGPLRVQGMEKFWGCLGALKLKPVSWAQAHGLA
ncbi:hypothetical protein Pyn_12768 [Prunus yedoensis var. nudiflora]|uniref:Uncharacterized protein n=1 Tax=Prunus yedoensis var. nudiflora TaxID=2094558 RepID=A0A314XSN8_PRUYE|nr:hypothetical protein Pyn_12768 [Prunus yedoensis var. nudiflora]